MYLSVSPSYTRPSIPLPFGYLSLYCCVFFHFLSIVHIVDDALKFSGQIMTLLDREMALFNIENLLKTSFAT